MRKILSALLAVMMLVSVLAALPAFADDAVETIDGTVFEDYYDSKLVVTEVMVNSRTNVDKYNDIVDTLSTSKTHSLDAFDYIEIYNRSDEVIDLYDYSLLRRANYGQASNHAYEMEGTFDRKNYITPGSIYNKAYGVDTSLEKQYCSVVNPGDTPYDEDAPVSQQLHYLLPGQFAVIWFWTGDCNTVSVNNKKSMAAPDTNYAATENAHYFPEFRDFYNVPDETIVLAVYAQYNATSAKYAFDLTNHNAHMYALAREVDENGEYKPFDLGEPAFTAADGLNEKIESLFCWGVNTRAGIPTSDGTDHQATNYMPPVVSPDLYNTDNAAVNENWTNKADYVQTGHSLSYKEMAIFKYAEDPTVGSMPLYQWAYVDFEGLMANWDALAERADDEIETVVRAKVYAEVEKQITEDVNFGAAGEGLLANQKPEKIKELLAEANKTGGEIDQKTAARLADPDLGPADLQEHYVSLLKTIICDYDEVIEYKVYATEADGSVKKDEDGNPVNTDESLLFDAEGALLDDIVGGEYVWVSRLTDRFVELNAYVLVDAEQKDEELNEPPLVDREELEEKHEGNGGFGINNRGQVTVNGQTYTKYAQTGSTNEYFLGADGKFYTMKVTNIPAVTQTVSKLTGLGIALVIVGAVIAVAGIAVAVFLVIKKKNKPVAADDVAAEGEVEIIDETAEAEESKDSKESEETKEEKKD